MKRKHVLFASTAMLALLASCSGGGDAGETTDTSEEAGTTTISFFGWGSAEEQENFQKLTDTFMAQNPNIKVVYSATASSSYMTTLRNKGNSLPDVFYMPDYEFMAWADSGKLLAMDDYVTEEELDSVWELGTDMYRYNRDTFTLGQSEDPLYGLPKDLGPYPLVYNKDLLNTIITENNLLSDSVFTSLIASGKLTEEGYPSAENPMSFDEFNQYLVKITTSEVYGIGYYELQAAVYSNNADFFSEDKQTEGISDQNFIDAVQFIADLSTKYHTAPTADEQSSQNAFQRFMNAGCVFTFMGPWDCAQFWDDLTFEFDVCPVPYGPAEGAESTAWVGSVAYCVAANSSKKSAAMEFIKFLTFSETSSVMNYQLGQAIPNLVEVAEGDYLDGVGLTGRQLMPSNRKVFVDTVKGTGNLNGKNRCRYYTYDYTFIDDLETSLNSVYQGSQTAEEFLTSYKDTYQRGLDDSNAYLNG